MSGLIVTDKDGAIVEPGSTVTSFRGQHAVLVRATRAADAGRSGKVLVDWQAPGPFSGRAEYYDRVFDLAVAEAKPAELVIGLTNRVGGIHAARSATITSDGWAQSLCSSSLMVSVEHDRDGVPVPAELESRYEGHLVRAERPDCLRCIRSLELIARKAS